MHKHAIHQGSQHVYPHVCNRLGSQAGGSQARKSWSVARIINFESTCLQVRPGPQQAWRRLAQGVGVAVLTIGTMFTLSYLLGRCVDVPAWRERNYGYTFHCPSGAPSCYLCTGVEG